MPAAAAIAPAALGLIGGLTSGNSNQQAQQNANNQNQQAQQQELVQQQMAAANNQQALMAALQRAGSFDAANPNPVNGMKPITGPPKLGPASGFMGGGIAPGGNAPAPAAAPQQHLPTGMQPASPALPTGGTMASQTAPTASNGQSMQALIAQLMQATKSNTSLQGSAQTAAPQQGGGLPAGMGLGQGTFGAIPGMSGSLAGGTSTPRGVIPVMNPGRRIAL